MCPVCVANAVITVAGVSGTAGGLTTIALRILRRNKDGRVVKDAPVERVSAGEITRCG